MISLPYIIVDTSAAETTPSSININENTGTTTNIENLNNLLLDYPSINTLEHSEKDTSETISLDILPKILLPPDRSNEDKVNSNQYFSNNESNNKVQAASVLAKSIIAGSRIMDRLSVGQRYNNRRQSRTRHRSQSSSTDGEKENGSTGSGAEDEDICASSIYSTAEEEEVRPHSSSSSYLSTTGEFTNTIDDENNRSVVDVRDNNTYSENRVSTNHLQGFDNSTDSIAKSPTNDNENKKCLFGSNGEIITVKELQQIFDYFKATNISVAQCEKWIDLLGNSQSRNDFQWALHKLGGFTAILVLYARVVEICPNDEIESKTLSLVLNQLKNHSKITDEPPKSHYNIIRYILNSEKSSFGFKSFVILLNNTLTPHGHKLIDYELLNICLLSCWRQLVKIRCPEENSSFSHIGGATIRRTLFECLLSIILDLLVEKNVHRDLNAALLKSKKFGETLLSICYNIIFESRSSTEENCLDLMDALRISSLVKSIFNELMAPVDAWVAISILKYGLYPLLSKDLPRLPQKDDAFFTYPKKPIRNSSIGSSSSFCFLRGKEAEEDENIEIEDTISVDETISKIVESARRNSLAPTTSNENQFSVSRSMMMINDDVPEIIGLNHNFNQRGESTTRGNNSFIDNNLIQDSINFDENFRETFLEALTEGLMSILLNALALLPDCQFHGVLQAQLNPDIFVAYSSHPSEPIKKLSLKLLSTYLSRVKKSSTNLQGGGNILNNFVKAKGFFLTSLYIQSNPGVAEIVLNICETFGYCAFPLAMSLLYSNKVINHIMEWIEEDEVNVIPSLVKMGFLPTVINIHSTSSPSTTNYNSTSLLSRPLSRLLTQVIRYCVLSSKEDIWKNVFSTALDSCPQQNSLTGKMFQEATDTLRKSSPFIISTARRDTIRKGDSAIRLLWLLERSTLSNFGIAFDKWLLSIFSLHVMEMDEEEVSDNWKYFVKRYKKRLYYLTGAFLCRVFCPNNGDFDFKHYTIRALLSTCPTVNIWLPRVIKCNEQVDRCLTAFIRLFLFDAARRNPQDNDHQHHLTSPSFQSLISQDGNLTLTVQMGNSTNNTPQTQSTTTTSTTCNGTQNYNNKRNSTNVNNNTQQGTNTTNRDRDNAEVQPGEIQMSNRNLRLKFEELLVGNGVLSPVTQNHSRFSAHFNNFKMSLESLESPVAISGVSYHELRLCYASIEKMRQQLSKGLKNGSSLTSSMSTSLSSSFSMSINSNHSSSSTKQTYSENTSKYVNSIHFENIFESVMLFAVEVLETVTKLRTRQEIEIAKKLSTRDEDAIAKAKWRSILERMMHPKGVWHFSDSYPKYWSLDQCEGPGRVRMRLRKEYLQMPSRFIMPNYRKNNCNTIEPLQYLFWSNNSDDLANFPVIQSEIQFIRFCTRIIPGEELSGEIVISSDSLHFIPEVGNYTSANSNNTSIPILNHTRLIDHVDVSISSIVHVLKRRFALEDRAAEIFVQNRSFLFVFHSKKDRNEFIHLLNTKNASNSFNSTVMDSSLTSMTASWMKCQVSNFEYLMYLNTTAGRTYCDLMQYPVFPFVLSKYDSPTLDLHAPQSYRNLKKPMAIQHQSKEQHFIATYNYLKRECDSTPFHYGSHYSNSGIVLHYLVRLPPYTQHFLKYQDGNFDLPDRSFHSLETTWRLASKESNTDFKESIPEFYYLPEFLQNLQNFDLGVRQNGERVSDVTVPSWANGDARLFTLVNRQALESNHVRKFLSDWIDLIFGFKQSGKAAIQAINVFHPSTYEGFEVDGVTDELLRRARKAMVSTYGQTPKKIFHFPHPRSSFTPTENCDVEVLNTVSGIRWGQFLGSPSCSELEVVITREYHDPVVLFESNSRILLWPKNTLIIGDTVVGNWDESGIRIKSHIIHLCIGDEITVCATTEDSIWVGYQSGRISVLLLSPSLDKVVETVELIGHYNSAIKSIDLNCDFSVAVSCSGENYAIVWDMNRLSFGNVIESTEGIDDVYCSRSTGDIVLLNKSSGLVSLKTINGFHIGSITSPDNETGNLAESVCISGLDPGRNVNVIAVGYDYGVIKFYSTWDLKFVNQIKVVPLSSLAIKSLRYSRDGKRLYCVAQTDDVSITAALQLPTN